MQLFRSTLPPHHTPLRGVLTHFGTAEAAVHRIDSLFASTESRSYVGNQVNTYRIRDKSFWTETPREAAIAFANFANRAQVHVASVDITNPLRLIDCWGEDPIGSGALELFSGNQDLTVTEHRSLKSIFHPFEKIIYPKMVRRLKRRNISTHTEKVKAYPYSNEELKSRKKRATVVGENFDKIAETVWLSLTLQLRQWALDHDYDSFVYQNNSEGHSDDSYVTLEDEQVQKVTDKFNFDTIKYLHTVHPLIRDHLQMLSRGNNGDLTTHAKGVFWAGQDILSFWKNSAGVYLDDMTA